MDDRNEFLQKFAKLDEAQRAEALMVALRYLNELIIRKESEKKSQPKAAQQLP